MKTNYRTRYEPYLSESDNRFADVREIKAHAESILIDDLKNGRKTANGFPLLVENDRIWVDPADHHNMIYGATGSGKTRRIIFLLIRIMCCAGISMIIPDVKGELKKKTAGFAKSLGYNILSLNMRDFSCGNRWNFFTEPYRLYHSGEKQKGCEMITDLVECLGAEAYRTAVDKFWPGMAKAELTGVGISMLEVLSEDMCTPSNLVHLCSEDSFWNMQNLCQNLKPNSPAAITLRGVFSAAEKTRQSIEATLYEMLRLFSSNRQLMSMMSESDFDMHVVGREKTIVYIEISDEKSTYYPLVTVFIKQMYELLINDADKLYGGKLPVSVCLILDEFQNIPAIPNFGNIMSTSRSRGILCTIVVQSMKRIESVYGLEAETIKGNCTNILYLYSRELPLLQEISALCGTYTDKNGIGRPLISASQLQRLPFGDALILHDRLYPYVTHLPDISEYGFEDCGDLPEEKISAVKDPDLVDLQQLNFMIRANRFPTPFGDETPAIDLYMEESVGEENDS